MTEEERLLVEAKKLVTAIVSKGFKQSIDSATLESIAEKVRRTIPPKRIGHRKKITESALEEA